MNPNAATFTPCTFSRGDLVQVVLWSKPEQRYRAWSGVITDVTEKRVKVLYDQQPGMCAYEANLLIGRQSIVKVETERHVESEWPPLPSHPPFSWADDADDEVDAYSTRDVVPWLPM